MKKGKQPAKQLSAAQKKHAAARAKTAGRPYPNLVDNMHEASMTTGASKKATKRKAAPKHSAAKKTARKASSRNSRHKTTAQKSARWPPSKPTRAGERRAGK